MPTDQFIEEVTDGTPATTGDLFAIQRNVAGVWTDYFIRAENIYGGGILSADVTIESAVSGFNILLPTVSGKAYVLVDPPIMQVTGNIPTAASAQVSIGDGAGGGQWTITFNDSETDAVYIVNEASIDVNAGAGDVFFQTSTGVFDGATVRVRFNFVLADI